MNNPRLFIIVEGETELVSLPVLLDGHFKALGVTMQCILVGALRNREQCGNFNLKMLDRHVSQLINSHKGCFITTFFDYYALGNGWPQYKTVHRQPEDIYKKLAALEVALAAYAEKKYSSGKLWKGHFVPHIQPHEFEALLFSQPEAVASAFEIPNLSNDIEKIIKNAHHNCELINDHYASCPSRRLAALTRTQYVKGQGSLAQAPIILKKIGIEMIRKKCRHFDAWLTELTQRLERNVSGIGAKNQE